MTTPNGHFPDTWVGSIVLSLAGRDSKRLFMVVSADEDNGYVYIADGKLRQIQHPKKKKCKHLKIVQCGCETLVQALSDGSLTNRQLHAALADICF